MAHLAKIIQDVRTELGDLPEPFRASYRGNGEQDDFDLPARNIKPESVVVTQIYPDGSTTTFDPTSYTVEPVQGMITFASAPDQDARIIVEGQSFGLLNDTEVEHFISSAVLQHFHGRTRETRYRDGRGFIRYDVEPMTLENCPPEEEVLVTILATIEALWALSTDAALDIDVQTAEGTSVPRGQRWRQLTAQIDVLTDKYERVSMALGVGLFSPEVMDVRRVSRTTGRLVPVFRPREYDEHGPPVRKTPPRSGRDVDEDGPASPFWSGGWGY